MTKKIINSSTPPVVWSVVDKMADDCNSNFSDLYSITNELEETVQPLKDQEITATLTGSVRNSERVIIDAETGTFYGTVNTSQIVSDELSISASQITVDSSKIVVPDTATVDISIASLKIRESNSRSVPVVDNNTVSLVPVSDIAVDPSVPIFKVAADDSTQRAIFYEETVKFSGTNGIRVFSSDDGEIVIDGSSVKLDYEYVNFTDGANTQQVNLGDAVEFKGINGVAVSVASGVVTFDGLLLQQEKRNASRTVVSGTTNMILPGQSAFLNVNAFPGYMLYKVQTSGPAWVRIYPTDNFRTLDVTRSIEVDPLATSGVIAEIVTSSSQPVVVAPAVAGFNDDFPANSTAYLTVTNTSQTTRAITVSLTVLQIEA